MLELGLPHIDIQRDRLSDLAGAREKAIKEGLAEGRAAAVEELKKLLGEGVPLEEALEKVKGEK